MVEGKRNSCPECGSIRVVNKTDQSKNQPYYKCQKCGWTGNDVVKVVWLFGSYSRGGGSIPLGARTKSVRDGVRDRPYCPVCKSVRLRKRVITRDYYCESCGNICISPKKMKWGSQNC